MIEIHCEGRGSQRLREKDHRGGNYVSSARFSHGESALTLPLARDLLRVGQAIFLADRAFRRGGSLGRRTRRLTVTLPVEEPAQWEGVKDDVSRFAEFASQDLWLFEFTHLKRRGPRRYGQSKMPLLGERAAVHLFSNGLDSLCGAAAAFERGETPLFVSHAPPGLSHAMRKIAALQDALGFTSFQPLFFNVNFRAEDRDARGKRNMFPERSRRTRPVLFLSMAGAAALELGIPKICLNENGVLAINLPFQPDQHGTNVSRHAHPHTLRLFESLLRAIWPFKSKPEVRNPFSRETKADEIKHLGEASRLAIDTISCEYAGQQRATLINWLKRERRPYQNTRECGLCFPCLIRRSALEVMGVMEPTGHYVFDARLALKHPTAYAEAPLYGHVASRVRDLREFAERMESMKPSEFALRYLCDLSLIPGSPGAMGRSVNEAHALYRRFAKQFMEYIGE